MVQNNKVLTVSYGTFSCTLEGFEDSFDTMKAIAEYFRDLASDDRYFGAEPPQPDAEMLTRIAQREVDRQVEARTSDGAVHLRAAEPAPVATPAAAEVSTPEAAPAAPVEIAEVAKPEAVDVPPQTLAEAPQAEEQAEPAPVVIEAKVETPEPAEQTKGDGLDLAAIAAAVAEPKPAELPPVQDLVATDVENSQADAKDDSSPAADSIAAKLQRIRAVVAQAPRQEEFSEDEHAELFVTESAVDIAAAMRSNDEAELAEEEDSQEQSEIAEALERIDQRQSGSDVDQPEAESEAVAEEEPKVEAAAEVEPEIAAEVETEAKVVAEVEVEAVAEVETEEEPEVEAVAEVETAEEPEVEAVAEVETEEEPEVEAVAEVETEEEPEVEAVAEVETEEEPEVEAVAEVEEEDEVAAEAEAETVAEADSDDTSLFEDLVAMSSVAETDDSNDSNILAEVAKQAEVAEPEVEEPAVIRPRRARIVRVKRADLERAVETGALEEVEEEKAEPALRSSLSDADEAELLRELAAVEAELLATDEAAAAEQAAAEDEAEEEIVAKVVATTSKPAIARPVAETPDSDISRLMDAADEKLEDPEASSSRETYDHLRAAMAAAQADRAAGGSVGSDIRDDEYREDLASVVRPRRPAPTKTASRRPEPAQRPAPLKLVAEQRIDEEPAKKDGPVRPRRIASSQVDEAEFANKGREGGFAEYATESGAVELNELLEAAASYMSFVEGRDHFSRPQLMNKVKLLDSAEFNREDGLRSFGLLLREGKIEKTNNGQFTASGQIGFRPGQRAAG